MSVSQIPQYDAAKRSQIYKPFICFENLDGEMHTVQIDNRDQVAWDTAAARRGWKRDTHGAIMQTFMAWSAGKRAGLVTAKLDDFLEKCEYAEGLTRDEVQKDNPDAEVSDVADPTSPATDSTY